MKKIILIILLIALSSTTVFASQKIGEKINDVLYTDIITTINGQEVESFNINGRTAIYVKDAKKLGYDVLFNPDERLVTVANNEHLIPKYSDSKLDESQLQKRNIGDKINDVLFTDIKTVINNKAVESFNINNSTAIYATALKNTDADVEWLSDVRRVRISNVNNDSIVENTSNNLNNTNNSPEKITIDASNSDESLTIESQIDKKDYFKDEYDRVYINLNFLQQLLKGEGIRIIPYTGINQISFSKANPISSEKVNIKKIDTLEKVVYSNKIEVPISSEIYNSDAVTLVNSKNNNIENLKYKRLKKDDKYYLLIENTYYLDLGETYTVKGITGNTVISQEMYIEKFLTKDSFKVGYSDNYKSVIVPAQPQKGFYFPYELKYISQHGNIRNVNFETTKDILYAETINYGDVDYSFEHMMSKAKGNYRGSLSYSLMRETKYNGFSMISFFPRLRDEGGIYTHALDRQTIFGTKEWWRKIDRGNLYRIDKQFVAMQEDARMHLKSMGRDIGKPILTGFSGSALFANRINYLHPDFARALVIMDSPTMPFSEYNGVELKYPLGIADLEEITGKPFNKEKFLDTPQFWFVGSRDYNDGAYGSDGWGNYQLNKYDGDDLGLDRNQEGIDYRKAFGDDIVKRKEKIRKILKEKGFTNIEGHTYDLGHTFNLEVLKDIETYLDKIKVLN